MLDASVAIQVTVVKPTGNEFPDGALLTTGDRSTRSPTVGVPNDTLVSAPFASAITLGGAVIVGGLLSEGLAELGPVDPEEELVDPEEELVGCEA